MKFKTLSNGFSIPALGMGTWKFGGRETHDPGNDDESQIAALRLGLDAGFTLIDTAEMYAGTYAETLVGRAIEGYRRETLFLTSKVWKTHLSHDGVLKAAEDSLKRLGTDYLDLYLYHQVSEEIPLEETVSAMNLLIDRGLVRNIGVSNFAPERLRRAMACSEHPIVVDQVHYSLTVREAEPELTDFCRENDVILQAWRPLRGLTGGDSPVARELCGKYGLTFPQLALAWVISQKNTAAVAASMNPEHIPENREAADVTLDPDDVARLSRETPGQIRTGTVPLS